jgi:hypothetical protein
MIQSLKALLSDLAWNLRRLLTLWVWLDAIGLGLAMFLATTLLVIATRPAPQPRGPATALVNVIPAPSVAPTLPTAALTPTPTLVPIAPTLPAPPPGDIGVGAYVQVTGTGTDGLRMRSDPGLNGDVRFLGMDSEVFQILDGPREVDGYTWWQLKAPLDENRRGWAVSNYLVVVQNP